MSRITSVSQLLDQISPEQPALNPSWEDVLARAELLAGTAVANGDRRAVPKRLLASAISPAPTTWQRRRLALVAAAIVALVFAVVAAAYVLGHPIVDFGEAPKGSRQIVDDFGRLTVGATPIYVRPHQARRITAVRIDGKERVLWVAPMRHGGFCYQWSSLIGSCHPSDQGFLPGGFEFSGVGQGEITILGGSFTSARTARISIAFADGGTSEIPFVWITAPINGGFFLYGVPAAHRRQGHRPVAVTLLDSSDHAIYRQRIINAPPPARVRLRLIRHRIAGYGPIMVPARAAFSERRQLFSSRAPDGTHIGLWTAPARGGGTCFWTEHAAGCSTPARLLHPVPPSPPLRLTLKPRGRHVDLCCLVATNVARVIAHFQDGDRVKLTPRDGYLVWPVPARHYLPKHRLDRLNAYDFSGALIEVHPVATYVRALYPCRKPKDYGYGLIMCP